MKNSYFKICIFFFKYIFFISFSCNANTQIITGAENIQEYLPLLKGKNIAICGNHSSLVKEEHLIDFLIKKKIIIKQIFSPEHGFKGVGDAGEHIKNNTYKNIPVVSLYGKNKKPKKKDLKNIDILIFDIQDVGVRFYTYISTLHYIMEACAENNVKVIILDRPNPNAHYIDGPVLKEKHKSFVGMHPVPVVYGMTIGEYAKMINGEKWLKNSITCNLKIIPCKNYNHQSRYELPVPPSPNLSNELSVNLYPSLCFFEGTNVSIGRGTKYPFQIFGSPFLPKNTKFNFIPRPTKGAKNPKHKGLVCYGFNLKEKPLYSELNLEWLRYSYHNSKNKKTFFNSFFNKLAGNNTLKKYIINNKNSEYIKSKWKKNINIFRKIRKKYLIY